ncbi:MAG: excinuclease ABC subunit UvrC, partial [Pseudomonadota bacterium]
VYIMKDQSGRVIYVGKAKTLPKRVASYFQKNQSSYKTVKLVSQVEDFDFIVTDNEKEALILENSLIKKHRPRYNIILRDDKTYPSLRLTVGEDFPRLEVVRKVARDGAVYFGPFSSATAMRQTIRLIRTIFPLRQCKRSDVMAVKRPCLNHQLGRCLGPCGGGAAKDEYRAMVDEVILFFQGKNRELTDILSGRMKEAAARLDFEAAARFRDRLNYVERTLEKQKVVSPDLRDQDVIGLARDHGQVMASILFIRRGALLGARNVPLGPRLDGDEEVIDALLGQYYGQDNFTPQEVLVPVRPANWDFIQEWLKEKRGSAVRLFSPSRGPRKHLLELAEQNARTALAERIRAAQLGGDALLELQKKLSLPTLPHRIECFDMSHLRGDASVGAMVVLEDGKWVKSAYRKYRIKSAPTQDDYGMMSETLGRRLQRADPPKPDLLLLDGGRGQLGAVLAVIEDLGVTDPPPLAGLAKGRDGEPDRVWLPGRKNPADLKADSPGLLLLMKVRDEAHRFVQSYHHQLRAKSGARSNLDVIPGVGPARRKALLDHFGSLDAVKGADLDELSRVQGLGRAAAAKVHEFFHGRAPEKE